APAVWGYLTRDGTPPDALRRLARAELARYPGVEVRAVAVHAVERLADSGFVALLATGERCWARLLLLATGVVDELPPLEGVERFYGVSVHHCPYCDGWEERDKPIAIYGKGHDGAALACELTGWTRDLALCTDGPAELAAHDRARLRRLGIPVREERITRLEGTSDGRLERIVFAGGAALPRTALFFDTGQHHRADFARQLGCQFTPEGGVLTSEHESTCVPGVFVAGDASRREQYAIVAAGEGALAAMAMNAALLKADLAMEERG
ncbi:MAG TPA: NAD(P)/FAD-dependent oxidoreductase, partial [Ktedonobacterales bacterium]|nr:NAD(P)/FAD-dependent oxidoreductase [Ktedonobacterales bacterium]